MRRFLVVVAALFVLFVFSCADELPGGPSILGRRGSSTHGRRSSNIRRGKSGATGVCDELVKPAGYPCTEHIAQTKDGYLLGLQRVSSRSAAPGGATGPPVLLIHGLMMSGDAWFLDSPSQSLGFILADNGFDVWAGSVRGTRWSRGHVSLSDEDKEFWDWSWQDLALYDLPGMAKYISSITNSKIFIVGHSQGTIMSFAAFTQPDIVSMVEAAALLSPITYLDHITAPLPLELVKMHLDQVFLLLGIHELNVRSKLFTGILEMLCQTLVNCADLLTEITGKNCCFNSSRISHYLNYEPHATSMKNMNHLFQMIRYGTFKMYDYGTILNLKLYGNVSPPQFDLSRIPESLPLWMAYGGRDTLADVTDVKHTLRELKTKPQLLYLENYAHIDFLLSVTAKEDLYNSMIQFFRSQRKISSY